jgi:hypothetical protein
MPTYPYRTLQIGQTGISKTRSHTMQETAAQVAAEVKKILE